MLKKSGVFGRLPAFRRARGETPVVSRTTEYAISLLFFAGVLALRFWIDPYLPPGFPYLTFFPAVVICGFVFGVQQGALVALLSGLAAWYFFIPPYYAFSFSPGPLTAMALYLFVVVTDLTLIHLMVRAYTAELEAQNEMTQMVEHQEVMATELDHRLKNVFATMNAVIMLSQKHASTPEELASKLRQRLNAMARSNLVLRGLKPGDEMTLDVVLLQALEPFGVDESNRFSAFGNKIAVSGQAVVVLSLILHELGTNAAKYGAFSVPAGRVDVEWTVVGPETGEALLTLRWVETGGPQPRQEPEHAGFGSTLMRRVLGSLKGTSTTTYPPSGAVVEITLPMTSVLPFPAVAAG